MKRPGPWTWFKCRVLNVHSPSRAYLGSCPCQKKGQR